MFLEIVILGQVTIYNLDSVYFSSIDPSFVSGTWLLPPVPTHRGQILGRPPQSLLVGNAVELRVHVVDSEHGGGLAGDRCQVPGKQDPEDNQLHPSTPVPA